MTRAKLSDDIVIEFLRRIGAGELSPGDPLPAEAALSTQFGVGRSVTREALRSLASKGFLELRQGAATVVAARSKWQLLDPVYSTVAGTGNTAKDSAEALRLLKPMLASLAATRATSDDIDTLRKTAEELSNEAPSARVRAAEAFDEVLVGSAHNGVLTGLWAAVRALGGPTAVPEHGGFWQQQILRAIEKRDPEAAAAAAKLSSGLL